MKRDYINENDWKPAEINAVLDLAGDIKKEPARFRGALAGKTLAMIFEKSSTRTRVSFEAGMFQLGGLAVVSFARGSSLRRRDAVREPGASIRVTRSLEEGLAGARAVYTDVWASMGQEAEAAERTRAFEDYRVTERVFAMAAPDAIFLHCLPAHRGEEVAAVV